MIRSPFDCSLWKRRCTHLKEEPMQELSNQELRIQEPYVEGQPPYMVDLKIESKAEKVCDSCSDFKDKKNK